jgi:sporulation protein YlmC with PRC-barrel domain
MADTTSDPDYPTEGHDERTPVQTRGSAAVEDGAPTPADAEAEPAAEPTSATYNAADWRGKMLIDRYGEKIGKLQDVYVDVETDEPQFATVKEGFIGRHLTFVPLGAIKLAPEGLQVAVEKEQVRSAPDIDQHGEELSQADESALYHHYEMNYTPPNTESGRRLARR